MRGTTPEELAKAVHDHAQAQIRRAGGWTFATVVSSDGGTPPTLTLTLRSSTVPVAGVTYSLGYAPNPGDRVVVLLGAQGDLFVIGAQASDPGAGGGPDDDSLFIPMVIPTSAFLDTSSAVTVDATSMPTQTTGLSVVAEGDTEAGGTGTDPPATLFQAVTAPGYDFGLWALASGQVFQQFSSYAYVAFGIDGPAGGPSFSGGIFAVTAEGPDPSMTPTIHGALRFGNVPGVGLLMNGLGAPPAGSAWLGNARAFWLRTDGSGGSWIYQTSDYGNSWTAIL